MDGVSSSSSSDDSLEQLEEEELRERARLFVLGFLLHCSITIGNSMIWRGSEALAQTLRHAQYRGYRTSLGYPKNSPCLGSMR